AGTAAGRRHRGVAVDAGRLQPLFVAAPQLVLLRAEKVQVVPGEDAGAVAVREGRLDRVVPDRLEGDDLDLALARLQHFLARAVALHFRRRRVDPHQLEGDAETGAVVERDFQRPRRLVDRQVGGLWHVGVQ